jgi:hypothetical protein
MGSIMKTFKRCLTLTLLLLLTGCLATSYDAAMKREPVVIPPSPPEAKATLSPGSIWPGATSNNLLFTDRKAQWPILDRVRREFFVKDPPTSTGVGVNELDLGAALEVNAIAVVTD